jgi:hypothetical protein
MPRSDLQQQPREQVHARSKRVKIEDRFEEAFPQVDQLRQEHPAQVELEA